MKTKQNKFLAVLTLGFASILWFTPQLRKSVVFHGLKAKFTNFSKASLYAKKLRGEEKYLDTTSEMNGSATVKLSSVISKPVVKPVDVTSDKFPNCAKFFGNLLVDELEIIFEKIKQGSPDFIQCAQSDDMKEWGHANHGIKYNCIKKPLKGKVEALNCKISLMVLKAQFVLQNINRDDLGSMTYDQLVAYFYDRIWQLSDEKDIELFGGITNELERRNPHHPTIAKIQAASLIADVLSQLKDKKAIDPDQFKEIDNKLSRAYELNPKDWHVFELRFIVLSKMNPRATIDYAKNLRAQFPNSGIPLYYLASLAWKFGNRQQARGLLNAAISKDPENQRYKDTLFEMDKSDPAEMPFHFYIAIDPSEF